MSNISKEINELISTTGKNAPDMTKALKKIGEGDMQNGIKRMADYCTAVGKERGYSIGDRNGIIKGSLVTLLVVGIIEGGFYIKNRYAAYQKEKLDAEGNNILRAIKDSVPSQDPHDEDNSSFSDESKEILSTDIQQKG